MTSFATNNRFSNSTNNTFNEIKSKNNAVLVSNLCQTITMQDINVSLDLISIIIEIK
jgi:hypothetical protein